MSKYTTEVRFICENAAGLTESSGFSAIEDKVEDGTIIPGILSRSIEKVFDFDFPIFDETYRPVLEKKILRHYYTREISEETVGLWKLRLCDRLNIIMPFYNQMYNSELIKFNPLYDVNLTRTHSGKKDNEERSEINSTDINTTKTNIEREEDTTQNNEVVNASNSVNDVSGVVNIENSNDSVVSQTGKTDGQTATNDATVQHDEQERWDKYADTPQGAVTGLANDTYLTNARHITDARDNTVNATGATNVTQNTVNNEIGKENGNEERRSSEEAKSATQETGKSESTANITGSESSNGVRTGVGKSEGKNVVSGTDSYVENVMGKQGVVSYSKMLMEFRQTFLNIDNMVIEELSDLFFGLW